MTRFTTPPKDQNEFVRRLTDLVREQLLAEAEGAEIGDNRNLAISWRLAADRINSEVNNLEDLIRVLPQFNGIVWSEWFQGYVFNALGMTDMVKNKLLWLGESHPEDRW